MKTLNLFKRLRSDWRPILLVHGLFALLGVAILMPLFGLLLQGTLLLSGNAAVVDQDIARLILSPLGLIAAVLLLAILLAIAGLEMGALQAIALANRHQRHISAVTATRFAFAHAVPLLQLTLALILRVLVYLLPYLVVVAALALTQLGEYDINYYLAEHPPEFILTVGAAVLLAIPLFWLLGRRLLGWSLALPLVLFCHTPPIQAFAASESLVAGNRKLCLRAVLGWALLALLLSTLPLLCLDLGMILVLGSGSTNLTNMALLLGVTGAAWTALNFIVAALTFAGFTFVVADLFQQLSPEQSGLAVLEKVTSDKKLVKVWNPGPLTIVAAMVAAVAVAALLFIARGIEPDTEVLIIAHRGAAGAAPENTLASVRQAIADNTDWVEIDVQETRDGEVVVVHDSDFMKLAGDPVKVWDADLERIQQIDIGSWFDPQFSDQRVPTLAQVLEEIKKGNSRLVIELKYYGHDQQLEQRVVDVVEAANMADSVVVMSLKLNGVQKLKSIRPGWSGGLLAATALGNITKLDSDFLAVNQNMVNARFINRAHQAGKQVFVWTVNDALSLSHWMSMGVDGVITDEPALARDILNQRAELSTPERLLLSAAMLFGRPEAIKQYRDDSP